MNLNDFYENIPADQHGNIVVSDGAVTVTQQGKSPVALLKKTADANADLTDGAGQAADRTFLEKNISTLKPVAEINKDKF